MTDHRVGIVVGGGPAPGINGVISSAALAAMDLRHQVIGFLDGFESLCTPGLDESMTDKVQILNYPDVTHIYWEGGSILRTSRKEPTDDEIRIVIDNLKRLKIRYFISIGGDDTATTALRVAEKCDTEINFVHVPKTIDNDLPLPGDTPTFGFQTARDFGAEVVTPLLYDAKATRRWFIVVAMGRKAGHLALGIGKGAGATLTIIPEEFKKCIEVELRDIAEIILGAMIKRRAQPMSRMDGVAIVAEGVAFRLKQSELQRLKDENLATIRTDEAKRIKLSEIMLGRALQLELEKLLRKKKEPAGTRYYTEDGKVPLTTGIITKDVGYELRCRHPIRFDVDYTRNLGYAAVIAAIKQNRTKCMVSCPPISGVDTATVEIETINLAKLRDCKGRIPVRMVDINSLSYRVARSYMIRLEESDFEDPDARSRLAEVCGVTQEEFVRRFQRLRELQAFSLEASRA